MTKDEFAAKLIEQARVDFGGSRISVPSGEIAEMITKTIKLVLPDGEVIVHGVQVGQLSGGPHTWEGTLMWLLSLHSHLLALTADARYEGTGGGRIGKLHIEHQFHRKERVKANLRVRWAYDLEHAHLTLHCDDSLIEVFSGSLLSPDALCQFAGTILPMKGEEVR